MYTADRVPAASLQTRPESSIHLLLHLSVSPLHCAQIPVAGVVSLHLWAKNLLNTGKLMHQWTSAAGRINVVVVPLQRRPLLLPHRFCTPALRSSPLPFLTDKRDNVSHGSMCINIASALIKHISHTQLPASASSFFTCVSSIEPRPPLNMIGLIHSRRSPLASRMPKERAKPTRGNQNSIHYQ